MSRAETPAARGTKRFVFPRGAKATVKSASESDAKQLPKPQPSCVSSPNLLSFSLLSFELLNRNAKILYLCSTASSDVPSFHQVRYEQHVKKGL
ncbi:hypothetical protein BTVI_141488 [Pitangus sulphuratus]|nr:hypothetical protein BTVI_141488 [Pitangus sulphuratus]